MLPALLAVAAQQGGVVTRRQALAAGHPAGEIRALTRPGGPWVVVRRGAYALRTTWDLLDEYVGKPLARDWAAHLTMQRAHVMSHESAGRAHGFSLLRRTPVLSHVTRPGVGGSRTEHGVKHHLSQGLPWTQSFAGGLPVTPLARTAVDVARDHGFWAGVCAMDSALSLRATERDFARALVAMKHFPYIRTARQALAMADPGAENAGESMLRILVAELGLPGHVQTQYPVRIGDKVVWLDLVVGCHDFEFDGFLKFKTPEEGGVADRPAGQIAWNEKERQRLVCAEGLGMSRVIWADYWGEERDRARRRLHSDAMLTVGRLGTVRPAHLDAFAHRMRHERARRIYRTSAV